MHALLGSDVFSNDEFELLFFFSPGWWELASDANLFLSFKAILFFKYITS